MNRSNSQKPMSSNASDGGPSAGGMRPGYAGPIAIELFCGAGGTSYGFSTAGFDVRVGVDIDADALRSFKSNHPNAETLEASVEDRLRVNGDNIRKLSRSERIDVLIGGPSCQGYSTIGRRIEDDPRNRLFIEYIRLVRELRPRWLLFENVKGMLLYGKGRFIKSLRDELENLGYSVTWDVLNAADYGVPQRRQRLFLIGTNDIGIQPTLPPPRFEDPRCETCSRPDASNRVRWESKPMFARCPRCNGTGLQPHLNRPAWVSAWDAIGDLPIIGDEGGTDDFVEYSTPVFSAYQSLMRQSAPGYDLHRARRVSKYAYRLITQVSEGEGIRSIPAEHLPDRFKKMRTIGNGSLRRDCTTLYHRISRSLPSYTITCSFTNVASGAFVHPIANRAITIREAARLQSFPDRFKFVKKNVKRQIGNAVPPLMAQVLAEHILPQFVEAVADIDLRRDEQSAVAAK